MLDMVDNGKIAFRPAVELSYLTKEEQTALLETMSYEDATPSLAQAIKMKEFSRSGKLNDDVILSIMSEEKPNQREKFTFPAERLRKYIPQTVPFEKTEDYVLKALEYYQRYQQRQRDSRDSR
jgi:ParB family chromosome partitioning protein